MEIEFKLGLRKEDVSHIIESIKKEVHSANDKRKIHLIKLIEIGFSKSFIEPKVVGSASFTEKDKKHLLNIIKKNRYISDDKYTMRLGDIEELSKKGEEDIATCSDMIYSFINEPSQGSNIDYEIWKSSDNDSTDSTEGPNRSTGIYTFRTACAQNSKELSEFLEYTSRKFDALVQKKSYIGLLGYLKRNNKSLDALEMEEEDAYSIEDLYRKDEQGVFLIDRIMENVYKNRTFYEKALFDSFSAKDPPVDFIKKKIYEEKMYKDAVKEVISILKHSKDISHEIRIHEICSELAKILGADSDSFEVDTNNLLEEVYLHHDKLAEIHTKRKADLMGSYSEMEENSDKNESSVLNYIKKEIEKEETIIRTIEEARGVKKEIDTLEHSQKEYINDKIKKDFEISSRRQQYKSKKETTEAEQYHEVSEEENHHETIEAARTLDINAEAHEESSERKKDLMSFLLMVGVFSLLIVSLYVMRRNKEIIVE